MSKFKVGDLVVTKGHYYKNPEDGLEFGIIVGFNNLYERMMVNMYKIGRDRVARYYHSDFISSIGCNLVVPKSSTLHFLLQSVGIFINEPEEIDSEIVMDIVDSDSLKETIKEAICNILFGNRFNPTNNVCLPEIKNVYFNNPLTVVIWEDGTKTFVKNNDGDDKYDPEKALAMAISKKALGNKYSYYDEIFSWMPSEWIKEHTAKEIGGAILQKMMNAYETETTRTEIKKEDKE